MDRRELIIGATALGSARLINLPAFFNLRDMTTDSTQPGSGNIRVSDRDRAKLRGLVKAVVGEDTTTEYDLSGNLLSWRTKDPDGREYGDTYSYDDRGRVHSILSRRWDGSTTQKLYSYDDSGRPLDVEDSSGEHTTFEYDKQGHKAETRVIKKTDEQVGAAAIRHGRGVG